MKLCLMILSVSFYMLNGLEHTAILSHFLTFITGSSSRVSTMHTTFYLTSLLQIYELKRRYETSRCTFLPRYEMSRSRYETTRLRNVLHPSKLLRSHFSSDLTMYWFPLCHFRCMKFKPLVIWKILLFLPYKGNWFLSSFQIERKRRIT
jgi:hypothetical protein